MDRRDSIKTLILGTIGAGFVPGKAEGAEHDAMQQPLPEPVKRSDGTWDYGRTPGEKERDRELMEATFFTDHEMATITILTALILSDKDGAGSAVDAGVPEFLEFIVKDMPYLQTRLRGGMMWLDNYSNRKHGKDFIELKKDQQTDILDEIAYSDDARPEVSQGVFFFREMRNLTLTGYYTTEMGYKDLGYKGNTPNIWDGVPEEVLKDHDVSYDEDWLAKCVNQDRRAEIAEWDEDGNLLNN